MTLMFVFAYPDRATGNYNKRKKNHKHLRFNKEILTNLGKVNLGIFPHKIMLTYERWKSYMYVMFLFLWFFFGGGGEKVIGLLKEKHGY